MQTWRIRKKNYDIHSILQQLFMIYFFSATIYVLFFEIFAGLQEKFQNLFKEQKASGMLKLY